MVATISQRSLWQRLKHGLGSGKAEAEEAAAAAAAAGSWVQAAAASAPPSAPMVAALKNEATLSRGLADAIFETHDRKTAKKRKRVNAVKIVGGFFALSTLDFTLSNI